MRDQSHGFNLDLTSEDNSFFSPDRNYLPFTPSTQHPVVHFFYNLGGADVRERNIRTNKNCDRDNTIRWSPTDVALRVQEERNDRPRDALLITSLLSR